MLDKAEQYLKRTLINSYGYLIARILTAVAGFISLPIFTRLLGPSKYGDYSLLLAIISVLTVLSSSWIKQSIIRYYYVIKNRSDLKQFISNHLIGYLLILSVIVAVSIPILFYFNKMVIYKSNAANIILLSILTITLISIFESILPLFRVNENIKLFSYYNCFYAFGKIGISWILLSIYIDIRMIFLATDICLLVIIPHMLSKTKLHLNFSFKYFNKEKIVQFIKFGYPYTIVTLSSWILSFFNRFILEHFHSSREVGIYSAVFNLSNQSINVLFSAIMMSVYPMIVHIWEKEGEDFSSIMLQKMIGIFWMIAFPSLVGLISLSLPIMTILTSSEFIDGVKIIPILSLSSFLIGFNQYLTKPYELKEKTYYISHILLVTVFINVVLSFFLIPKFSYSGAAIAYLISYIFYTVMNLIISRKLINYNLPMMRIIKSSINSLIMGCIIYFSINYFNLSNYWLALIFIGIAVYIGLTIITKTLSESEITYLKNNLYKIIKK